MADPDPVLFFFVTGLAVAEKMTFQKGHRSIFAEPVRNLSLHPYGIVHRNLLLPADGKELCRHLFTERKQLVRSLIKIRILILRNRHCHPDILTHLEKLLQQPVLNRGKSGKTVQRNDAVPQNGRLRHPLAEQIQNLLSCDIFFLQIGIEAFVHLLQIRKLIIKRGSFPRLLHHPVKLFFSNIVLGKLGNDRFHFADIPLPLQISTKDSQIVLIIPRNLPENQIFPLVIQNNPVVSPGLFHDTISKPSKT